MNHCMAKDCIMRCGISMFCEEHWALLPEEQQADIRKCVDHLRGAVLDAASVLDEIIDQKAKEAPDEVQH